MTIWFARVARWLARSGFCLCAVILSQSARAVEPPLPALLDIPAGAFIAGSDRSERDAAYELDTAAYGSPITREQGWYEGERERGVVETAAYAIMATPVTNRQYATFVAATGHRAPDVDRATWKSYGLIHPYQRTRRHAWRNAKPPAGREDHPVVLVDVADAEAYAQWLTRTTGRTSDTLLAKPAVCGRRCDAPAPAPEGSAPPRRGRTWRLPTEPEWEKAARGTEGRRFPWGDAFDAQRLNSADRGPFDTLPVGRFPDGASPYGMLDAAGQVFEWTATREGERRVVKGGSWDDRGCGVCRPAARHARPAQLKHILIGFRLLRED